LSVGRGYAPDARFSRNATNCSRARRPGPRKDQ
jgi:hypothetical protein